MAGECIISPNKGKSANVRVCLCSAVIINDSRPHTETDNRPVKNCE